MANQQPLVSMLRNVASWFATEPAQNANLSPNEMVRQNQWYQHAQKMFGRKDYSAALEACERAALKHEQSDDLWQLRGAILQSIERLEAARENVQRSLALNEANATAWESLSQIHTASGHSDEAL